MEDEVGGRERIWVHCAGAHNKSRYWYQSGASPERLRGAAGVEKLRPGTSREQKPSKSDPQLQPPPSWTVAITIA